MESDYKLFFNERAELYDSQLSEIKIVNEVDCIENLLELPPNALILDVGCGSGWHSIEFAKRGYHVTGIDFSPVMIELARKNAEKAKVKADFIEISAEDYTEDYCKTRFDAAISLHQGGFSLLSLGESEWKKDMAILGNISDLLKPGGKYYISFLNAVKMFRNASESDVESGVVDLWKSTKKIKLALSKIEGETEGIEAFLRYYTPAEITRMANRVHLKLINIFTSLDDEELFAYGIKK